MNNICRLCFVNTGITSIYEYSSGTQICAKIMHCCKNIRFSGEDDLPLRICACCEKDLDSTYCFILRCEETDRKLRSGDLKYLKKENEMEIKVEPDSISFPDVEIELYQANNDVKQEDNTSNSELKNEKENKEKIFNKTKKSKDSQSCSCSHCGRRCPNPSTLLIHMRTHTNERTYCCRFCDKKYKDGGSLKRHTERNHIKDGRERRFTCEVCGKSFYSKNDIKVHMRVHTGDTPYVCSECPARFTQINSLHRHQVRHTGEKPHQCPLCQKRFCSKEEVKKHSVSHTSAKKFTCPTCNTPFKYKNNLQKHIKKHTEMNKFTCNYCSRDFTIKGSLTLHMKRLHSSKSGYCNICSKDVPNIEVHTWKHTGERPLKCDFCPRSFAEQKTLVRHVNYRHKDTDKYKCMLVGCTVTFPSKQMLDFHVLKHHGNTIPYQCDKCSRGFYRKSDLARHKLGTHKEKLTE